MPDKRQDHADGASDRLIRERGKIQQGAAGDKIPGIDPAAAPLETDSEAGGARLHSPVAGRPAPGAGDTPSQPNAGSHGDAMREQDSAKRESRFAGPLIALAIIVVVGALLLIIM